MRKKIYVGCIVFFVLLSLGFTEVDEWSIRIGVRTDRNRDSYNFIGTSKIASLFYDEKDIPEPPPSPNGLCLYFPHYDWPFNPGRYASDFRPPFISGETYEFVVEAIEEKRLTLFWSSIAEAPKKFDFTLIDSERDISVDMSKLTEYSFSCEPGYKNIFRVVIKRRKRGSSRH